MARLKNMRGYGKLRSASETQDWIEEVEGWLEDEYDRWRESS
jgi:hypothetical protein